MKTAHVPSIFERRGLQRIKEAGWDEWRGLRRSGGSQVAGLRSARAARAVADRPVEERRGLRRSMAGRCEERQAGHGCAVCADCRAGDG